MFLGCFGMKRVIGALISLFALSATAAAQVPVAIIEDIRGKVDGVEFMDYVAPGKVIKLGPNAVLVLGYLKSCWHEKITGGTVVIGAEQSLVHLGNVQRVKVDCDAGTIQLSRREENQSAATVFRSLKPDQSAATPPAPLQTVYGLSPVVEVNGGGVLVIERTDAAGERYALPLKGNALVRGKFYDFAKAKKSLTAGGTYTATLGSRRATFKIDSHAASGSSPVIGRLIRL
jgi:hypothetical protein